jgi:3-oxoacyl-(acyl-carrier-protein) synthase
MNDVSKMPVFVHAAAFVNARTSGGPSGIRTWNPDGRDVPPDLATFFPEQPRMARLDRASRFVMAAASLLPGDLPMDPDRAAVVLGSNTGSLDADRVFAASLSERPLPAVYARTLPSIPAAELAIARRCRGPLMSLVQEGSPGILAIAVAVGEIASGRCTAALAGGYDAVEGMAGSGWAFLIVLGSTVSPKAACIDIRREPRIGNPDPFDASTGPTLQSWMHGSDRIDTLELHGDVLGSRIRMRLERAPITGGIA